jgi:hypothetical protein
MECPDVTFRKEVRHMKTDGDFDVFVQAFKNITNNGKLESLVRIHGDLWDHAHFNPGFLPWHRIFIKNLEVELQKEGAKYLPFWDWSIDSSDPLHSKIFTNDFFGSNDENKNIKDSEFSKSKFKTAYGKYILTRDYNLDDKVIFYHPSLLIGDMKENLFSKWSQNLEYGAHSIVHSVIGGKRGDMSKWTAPNDPIFWLHHAFIDKLWWEYQYKTGNHKYDGDAYGKVVSENDELLPWKTLVKNVLNTTNICVTYVALPEKIVKSVPKTTKILEPTELKDEWLNNTSVNKTVAENVKEKVKKDVKEINNDIVLGTIVPENVDMEFSSGSVVSVGLTVFVCLLF